MLSILLTSENQVLSKLDNPHLGVSSVVKHTAKTVENAGVCSKQGGGATAKLSGVEIKDIFTKPESFKGSSVKDAMSKIDKHIPEGWVKSVIKKGRGVKWSDGKGNQIRINYGNKMSKDPLHSGPYISHLKNGSEVRTPLKGNPILE